MNEQILKLETDILKVYDINFNITLTNMFSIYRIYKTLSIYDWNILYINR